MLLRLLAIFSLVISFSSVAGDITIDKRDSVIRNDIFDEKRERAEAYQRSEEQREIDNQAWSYELPLGCGLYRHASLTYLCGDGRYFRGDELGGRQRYRELAPSEVQTLNGK